MPSLRSSDLSEEGVGRDSSIGATIAVLKEDRAGIPVVELCRNRGTATRRSASLFEIWWGSSDARALKALANEHHNLKAIGCGDPRRGEAVGGFIPLVK